MYTVTSPARRAPSRRVPSRQWPSSNGLNGWMDLLNVGANIYGTKTLSDTAKEQRKIAEAEAKSQLALLQAQQATAEQQLAVKQLEAQIAAGEREARMEMFGNIAKLGIPVVLGGGALLYFVRRNQPKGRRRR